MSNWSDWQDFPPAENNNRFPDAPRGSGVYELRNKRTGEYVFPGISSNVAERMRSILPKPYGHGTRNNDEKRQYVLDNIDDIEYRTLPCVTKDDARAIEREMLAPGKYLFNT